MGPIGGGIGTPVPGCAGVGAQSHWNFCYDPKLQWPLTVHPQNELVYHETMKKVAPGYILHDVGQRNSVEVPGQIYPDVYITANKSQLIHYDQLDTTTLTYGKAGFNSCDRDFQADYTSSMTSRDGGTGTGKYAPGQTGKSCALLGRNLLGDGKGKSLNYFVANKTFRDHAAETGECGGVHPLFCVLPAITQSDCNRLCLR